jgi:competence protein ComEA
MSDSPPKPEQPLEARRDAPWIGQRDQASLLGLFASLLVMMAAFWIYHGGHRGQLVDIDRAEPLTAPYLVDINRADWPEMIQLPGLGETLARRIVTDRVTHGEFRNIDELQRVEGIGRRTLERLRPYLLPIPQDTDWAAQ